MHKIRTKTERSEIIQKRQPKFQTKPKPKVIRDSKEDFKRYSVEAYSFDQNQSSKDSSLLKEKGKESKSKSKADHNNFAKTAAQLADTNFNHHNPQLCICDQCDCGRHFCKLQVIKPDLTKNTIYQRSFYEQKAIPNIVNHDKEYERLKGPNLEMKSTYHAGFKFPQGDKIIKPRPQDLLKSQGPLQNLTSYSSQFPGYRGENQYVKPTDKHSRGYFPFRCKTSYANQFVYLKSKKDEFKYRKDHLKTGNDWYGSTTYNKFFVKPDSDYFAKPVHVIQKKQDNPNYNGQYQTTYKNQFVIKDIPICPAKIRLQKKSRKSYAGSINKFNQNDDFEGVAAKNHCITASKHCRI